MENAVKIIMAVLGLILVYLLLAQPTTGDLLGTLTKFATTETTALQGR